MSAVPTVQVVCKGHPVSSYIGDRKDIEGIIQFALSYAKKPPAAKPKVTKPSSTAKPKTTKALKKKVTKPKKK
jgi:hypothetical protein